MRNGENALKLQTLSERVDGFVFDGHVHILCDNCNIKRQNYWYKFQEWWFYDDKPKTTRTSGWDQHAVDENLRENFELVEADFGSEELDEADATSTNAGADSASCYLSRKEKSAIKKVHKNGE